MQQVIVWDGLRLTVIFVALAIAALCIVAQIILSAVIRWREKAEQRHAFEDELKAMDNKKKSRWDTL